MCLGAAKREIVGIAHAVAQHRGGRVGAGGHAARAVKGAADADPIAGAALQQKMSRQSARARRVLHLALQPILGFRGVAR